MRKQDKKFYHLIIAENKRNMSMQAIFINLSKINTINIHYASLIA